MFSGYVSKQHWATRWTLSLCGVLAGVVELPTLVGVAQLYLRVTRLAVPRFSPVRSFLVPPQHPLLLVQGRTTDLYNMTGHIIIMFWFSVEFFPFGWAWYRTPVFVTALVADPLRALALLLVVSKAEAFPGFFRAKKNPKIIMCFKRESVQRHVPKTFENMGKEMSFPNATL